MKRMREISIACIALMLLLTAVTIPYASAHTCDDPFITDLIAGGGNPNLAITVGEVHVCNDDENLYVTYDMHHPWRLTATHLHVAESFGDIPQTQKHNPIPGKFDYKSKCCYAIPLSGWEEGDELFIAAHAVVYNICNCKCETAWGDGDGFNDKNWATYFTYEVQAAVLP